MAINSIVTNAAALSAQNALRAANETVSDGVQALATGQRIVRAAIDAAGLAIGTVLATNVSTLRTALTSASQASSLLGVADGAVKNIGDILQRMKSLSVQANAGTVTDNERGFLNQEFVALRNEIDRISTSTKFNSTVLLNGQISGAVSASTNTNIGGAANTAATLYTVSTAAPTDGQTITINGVTVTFSTDSTRTDRVFVGANQTVTGRNLTSFLNVQTDARLGAFRFTDGAAGVVQVQFIGGATNATAFSVSSAAGTYTTGTAATATIAASNGTNGLSEGRVTLSGGIGDAVLAEHQNGVIVGFTGAINTGLVRNNSAFIGTVQGFKATYSGVADQVTLSLRVGSVVYTGTVTDTTPAANTAVTLTGAHDDGSTAVGSFSITLRTGTGSAVTTQAAADDYAKRIDRAFSTVTFSQDRDISSFINGGALVTNSITHGNLSDVAFDAKLSTYGKFEIANVNVSTASAGSADGIIEIIANTASGQQTFRSRTGLGTSIAAGAYTILENINKPGEFIGFQNGATVLSFDSADKAKTFETALEKGFGLDKGGTGLVFQVGIASTETISVAINNLTSSAIGISSLDISTASGATAASAVLDTAIQTVTSTRANVGALQSRFSFAASTLSSGIENTDAARAGILDTDIAAAASDFATSQVRVLAGISVLAQANQLPQNLLKLIG